MRPYNKKRKLDANIVDEDQSMPSSQSEVHEEALDRTVEKVADDTLSLITTSITSSYSVKCAKIPYVTTNENEAKLRDMALNQSQRIILNVGGLRFETTAPTLQNDPSSILASMVEKSSAFRPYEVDHVYTYFIDRDHRHFRNILNYLRNPNAQMRLLRVTRFHLTELLEECKYYELDGLSKIARDKLAELD